jgi:hypothetical protein
MPHCRSYGSGLDDDGIQLANSGAYASALAGLEARLGGTGPAFIETTNPYGGSVPVPAATLEFAHELAESWGLHGDVPYAPAPGWEELLTTGSYGAQDAYSAMAREVGQPDLAVSQLPGQPYPDVSAIRAGLGL